MAQTANPIRVTPIDGWGFMETTDGKLASPFEALITESHVDFDVIFGWRGLVISPQHKYCGLTFEMTPRHTTWSNTVVINIKKDDTWAFSGMADTEGLECDWL
ncbi:MAG: hypothetical protein ABIO43_00600 [Sphingomicrobium sp.]